MAHIRYQLDIAKKYPTLAKAPIVEAVLHWQSAASVELTSEMLKDHLRKAFPDYELEAQHNVETALKGSPDGIEVKHSTAWEGFRLTKKEAEEPAFVCQFKRDGLVFSRLAPYRGWQEFEPEAMKFWEEFVKIAKPVEIARLGTRYISQIPINSMSEVASFIEQIPDPLEKIGVSADSFFYQYGAKLGNLPYNVNLVQAVQPGPSMTALIVDIGVSTTDSISDFALLPTKLCELRAIKNDMFFTLIKDAEQKFGESNQ